MITKIRHFGILVLNLEKTEKFYHNLGFTTIYKNIEEWDEFGNLNIIKMQSPNNEIIEFIETCKQFNNHNIHLCFQVENLEEIYNKLKNITDIIVPPRLSPDKSVKVAFCYDINNIKLELVEMI